MWLQTVSGLVRSVICIEKIPNPRSACGPPLRHVEHSRCVSVLARSSVGVQPCVCRGCYLHCVRSACVSTCSPRPSQARRTAACRECPPKRRRSRTLFWQKLGSKTEISSILNMNTAWMPLVGVQRHTYTQGNSNSRRGGSGVRTGEMGLVGFFDTEFSVSSALASSHRWTETYLRAAAEVAHFRAMSLRGPALIRRGAPLSAAHDLEALASQLRASRERFQQITTQFSQDATNFGDDGKEAVCAVKDTMDMYDAALDDLTQTYAMIAASLAAPPSAPALGASATLLASLWENAATPLLDELKDSERATFAAITALGAAVKQSS